MLARTPAALGIDATRWNVVADLQGSIALPEFLLEAVSMCDVRRDRARRNHDDEGGLTVVPILKEGDCLIASIPSPLSDSKLLQLRDTLVEAVSHTQPRAVIVDVSVLDVMDSFAVRTLSSLAQMITLCGVETVIVGIPPEVASAMVQVGLTLDGVSTAHDVDAALARPSEHILRSVRAGY